MENLLTTILNECKKNKLMFRANAYELWNYGSEDMIEPWGYDIKALQKTFILRKILQPMDEMAASEFLLDRLKTTKTNAEFFDSMKR